MVARAARKSANDRYRVWDSWNTAFFTCFAATLSIIYDAGIYMRFPCYSKENDGNARPSWFFPIELAPICIYLGDAFVSSSFIVPVSCSIAAILGDERKKACMRFRGETRLKIFCSEILMCMHGVQLQGGARESCIFDIKLYWANVS